MHKEHDSLRRQAIGIVVQLPDTTACALTTIGYVRHLVLGFLYKADTTHLAAPVPCAATRKEHDSLRRLAMQIADQLPRTTKDALEVLGYAQDLVVGFLGDPPLVVDGGRAPGPCGGGTCAASEACSNVTAFPEASAKSR